MAANNRGKAFSKFDLDLEFGEKWEDFVDDAMKTAEVKTESHLWERTGNICIEYESYGKPSGIDKTEADVWIHNLVDENGYVMGFILPTKTLKKVAKKGRKVSGGDHNASRIYLLKIKELVNEMLKEK